MTDAIQLAKRNFRAQPILCARTKVITGLELLNRNRLDFGDAESMLAADVEAIKAAWQVANHFKGKLRVHCNVEMSSVATSLWTDTMAEYMCPGVVVELVERNDALSCYRSFTRMCQTVKWLRRLGGVIAMDDWTGTPIEIEMVKGLSPEIIKVNEPESLARIITRGFRPGTHVVVERIETPQQAREAERGGATELQGYWCDVLVESEFPAEFTPPGVTARNTAMALAA
ncbi:EAL domain protein [Paracidovorax citrulli]|uniref:EAL domain protein n=1 Tax=Paracidovorax citrulli TaxID=80869 RepID=UPI003FA77D1A